MTAIVINVIVFNNPDQLGVSSAVSNLLIGKKHQRTFALSLHIKDGQIDNVESSPQRTCSPSRVITGGDHVVRRCSGSERSSSRYHQSKRF